MALESTGINVASGILFPALRARADFEEAVHGLQHVLANVHGAFFHGRAAVATTATLSGAAARAVVTATDRQHPLHAKNVHRQEGKGLVGWRRRTARTARAVPTSAAAAAAAAAAPEEVREERVETPQVHAHAVEGEGEAAHAERVAVEGAAVAAAAATTAEKKKSTTKTTKTPMRPPEEEATSRK